MHPIEVTFRIVAAMDYINKRTHAYAKPLYAKVEGAVYVLQRKGVTFDTPLIEAIATGDDNHPLVKTLCMRYPRTWGELTAALDELYELALPPS